MNTFKKHIAAFLLLIMAFTAVPATLWHDLLANHTDAADNHCSFYHKDLGLHLEEKQNHCHLFKANTPLYDAVKVQPNLSPLTSVISAYKGLKIASPHTSGQLYIPSRAPPVA